MGVVYSLTFKSCCHGKLCHGKSAAVSRLCRLDAARDSRVSRSLAPPLGGSRSPLPPRSGGRQLAAAPADLPTWLPTLQRHTCPPNPSSAAPMAAELKIGVLALQVRAHPSDCCQLSCGPTAARLPSSPQAPPASITAAAAYTALHVPASRAAVPGCLCGALRRLPQTRSGIQSPALPAAFFTSLHSLHLHRLVHLLPLQCPLLALRSLSNWRRPATLKMTVRRACVSGQGWGWCGR